MIFLISWLRPWFEIGLWVLRPSFHPSMHRPTEKFSDQAPQHSAIRCKSSSSRAVCRHHLLPVILRMRRFLGSYRTHRSRHHRLEAIDSIFLSRTSLSALDWTVLEHQNCESVGHQWPDWSALRTSVNCDECACCDSCNLDRPRSRKSADSCLT